MPRRKIRKNHKGGRAWSKVQEGIANTKKIAMNSLAAATDMRIAAEKAANDIKNARERARQQQEAMKNLSAGLRSDGNKISDFARKKREEIYRRRMGIYVGGKKRKSRKKKRKSRKKKRRTKRRRKSRRKRRR